MNILNKSLIMNTHTHVHAQTHCQRSLVSPRALWFNTQKYTEPLPSLSLPLQPLFRGLMSCIDLGKSFSFLENQTLTYSPPSISFPWRQVVNTQLTGQLEEALAGFLFLAFPSNDISSHVYKLQWPIKKSTGKGQGAGMRLLIAVVRNTKRLFYVFAACEDRDKNYRCRRMNEYHNSLRDTTSEKRWDNGWPCWHSITILVFR